MAIQFDHTANGLVTITTTNAASPTPYTLRLPNGTGTNGQFLSTDGTGNLSFSTAASTYESLTTKPAVNVTFTGDVTGSGNINLTNSATNSLSIALTVATNSVALGTDTTGNYTANVLAGTGIVAAGTTDEGNVITVSLATSGVTAGSYGNAVAVPSLTVDSYGRITSVSNVIISTGGGGTTNYADLTNKPAANVNITGFVSGAANVSLGAGTNLINVTTVKANAEFYYSATAPSSPVVGDRWVHSETGVLYQYINDGDSSQWVDTTNYSAISTTPPQTIEFLSPFLLMGA